MVNVGVGVVVARCTTCGAAVVVQWLGAAARRRSRGLLGHDRLSRLAAGGAAPPLCSGCARLRQYVRAVLALRSAGWCVAAALNALLRSFPSLSSSAPAISHFSWRRCFGSASDEAHGGVSGARPRLVYNGRLSDVWAGALIQTNIIR